jgi:hypothetical protein
MMHGKGMISIWFFIGVILLIYGAIITIATLTMPQPPGVVLTNLHAGVWWGGFMFIVGLFYTVRFRPGTEQ